MSHATSIADDLRSYLAALPLSTQSLLLRRLQQARLRDEAEPASDLIIALLRGLIREDQISARQSGMPQRMFREPLEPFLVSETGSRKHRGWIATKSLTVIWRWLCGAPGLEDFPALADKSTEALLTGDHERAHEIGRNMRARSLPIITEALEKITLDSRSRMHLAAQLEGGRSLDDLADIAAVFRLEMRLRRLAGRLPPKIEDFSPELVRTVLRRLAYETGDLVYPFILVYSRLSHPAQLLRLPVSHAGTDEGARIAAGRLAGCVEVVLSDLDFTVERIIGHLDRHDQFEQLVDAVRSFYSLATGTTVAIDLDSASEWHARLAECRRRVSDAITPRISGVPAAIRRALKVRKEGGRLLPPDPHDVHDAEHAVRLMEALRPYRSELAVNAVLRDVMRPVESFLEAANSVVVQTLKTAPAAEKDAARQLLQVALTINTIVFGEEYAALLRRSGELADPPAEIEPDEDDEADLRAVPFVA